MTTRKKVKTGEAFCGSHPGGNDYDSPSYFNDEQTSWKCPLTPPQIDAAIMRAEGLRQGAVRRTPAETATRPHDGGSCDCGLPPFGRDRTHGVKCATRFKKAR